MSPEFCRQRPSRDPDDTSTGGQQRRSPGLASLTVIRHFLPALIRQVTSRIGL